MGLADVFSGEGDKGFYPYGLGYVMGFFKVMKGLFDLLHLQIGPTRLVIGCGQAHFEVHGFEDVNAGLTWRRASG